MKTKKILSGIIVSMLVMLAANVAVAAETKSAAVNAGIAYEKLNLKGKIKTSDIKDKTITKKDFKKGAVTSKAIKDESIKGEDLEDDIEIVTSGLAYFDGGIASEGDLVLDPKVGAAGSVVPKVDSQDNIGTSTNRWATIYADNFNYSNSINDANSGNTTVVFGNNNALDAVTITANTAISDAQWAVTNLGAANFASINGTPIGGTTPAIGTFTVLVGDSVQTDADLFFANTGESIASPADGSFRFERNTEGVVTIVASDVDGNAGLLINAGGTGNITLGDVDSDVDVISGLTVASGGITITAGGLEVTNGNITNVENIGDGEDWSIDGRGIASFDGVSSTGTVDFGSADRVEIPAATAGAACLYEGSISYDLASTGSKILVCNGAVWVN